MSRDFYTTSILPYAGIIIKICRAYSNSQEDFEDYYQEVCLQIWRSKDNFRIGLIQADKRLNDLIINMNPENPAFIDESVKYLNIIFKKNNGN